MQKSEVANMDVGSKESSTLPPSHAVERPPIAGVEVVELANVLTRSGFMMELFRFDWPSLDISVKQINWQQMNPGAVTDWHCHMHQTDRIVGVEGIIKVALYDGRAESQTYGASHVIRLGALRPIMLVVPAGVWHGLRNESGAPAGYINVHEVLYDYAKPDNWRARPADDRIPDIL